MAAQWQAVLSDLRPQVPESCLSIGVGVDAIHLESDRVVLTTREGQAEFTGFVAADGAHSRFRTSFWPEVRPQPAGYALLRGMVRNIEPRVAETLAETQLFVVHHHGHGLAYPVPGRQKTIDLSWALYHQAADDDVRPGMVPDKSRAQWMKVVEDIFPDALLEVVQKTEQLHLQTVADVCLPAYTLGNLAMVGDAGTIVRPHTGAGASRAIRSARHLGENLIQARNWRTALASWAPSEKAESNACFSILCLERGA